MKSKYQICFQYLQDLKERRAKIIIADVYDEVARQVMCEAYKLKMTAVEVITIANHVVSLIISPNIRITRASN